MASASEIGDLGGSNGDVGGREGVGVVVRMQRTEKTCGGGAVVAKRLKREGGGVGWGSTAKERISRMPPSTAGKRSSIYRGVTRHRWTGRYEAHLWDKTTWNQNQNKKGKQVYLGAYDEEEAAARAYDLAALKYWGPGTVINFPVSDYTRDLEEMKNLSREEYLASLRRKSSGFSRGLNRYRNLCSRWDQSLGRTPEPEYLLQYGVSDEVECGNAGGFCMERKIDLTTYITWWCKPHQPDPVSKSSAKQVSTDDVCIELRLLEQRALNSEPYQLPRLGMSHESKKAKKNSSVSALSILSRSAAYKHLEEIASKTKETIVENDEHEKKGDINKLECGGGVEKLMDQVDVGIEAVEDAGAFGLNGAGLLRNGFDFPSFMSAPLFTDYNPIDHLPDPAIWSSLATILPSGTSQALQVTKTETSSEYAVFGEGET
ncbi:hypothetical protein Droror1_Dr00002488 [Drosera rotundifolia]